MCTRLESGDLEKMFINMAHGQTGQFWTDTECVCSLTKVQIGGRDTQASSPSVPLPPQLTSLPSGNSVLSLPDTQLQPWKEFYFLSRKVSTEPCFLNAFWIPELLAGGPGSLDTALWLIWLDRSKLWDDNCWQVGQCLRVVSRIM